MWIFTFGIMACCILASYITIKVKTFVYLKASTNFTVTRGSLELEIQNLITTSFKKGILGKLVIFLK